ncbi:MAG TPA: T9SS type A sorting domain-containing protein [Saprospiraceae bacterium]|nr:T9SS type A sorting domain-containing protein [Saprospiraceae bacterium]
MKKLLWCFLFLSPCPVWSQVLEVLASGGQQFSGPTISISATIGEPIIGIHPGFSHLGTLGFQQGFLPLPVSAPEIMVDRNRLEYSENFGLFPNPATTILQVYSGASVSNPAKLRVFHASGVLQLEMETQLAETILDIQHLSPGSYWIVVHRANDIRSTILPFSKINL